MTVKEIRTLVKYNCFNKELWDRWSDKMGESSLNGYLNNSVWNKLAFLMITLILSIIGLSLRTVGKNSENDFVGFCLCVLSLIMFMCWYAFHWCRLGNDIETVGIALGKDASFVISTPIGQLEEMAAYRLRVQARIVLSMEEVR
jgi:threonine/homoserine efflux transporter RhtA